MTFSISVKKNTLKHVTPHGELAVEALSFFPDGQSHFKNALAIFTHGYTAEKTPLIPWAIRLADFGVPSIIFDQPGHFLASFSDIPNFDVYKHHVHELFGEAKKDLVKQSKFNEDAETKLIIGGHSLGGLLSIKALTLPEFEPFSKMAIGVGVGLQKSESTHLFQSKFYEKTMHIRSQFVSEHLSPKILFQWLHQEKLNIKTTGQKIALITGQDDVVVGRDGSEYFMNLLEQHQNIVTLDKPERLQHNQPELAASMVYRHVREFLSSN